MLNNIFFNVPFLIHRGKIWYSRKGHRRQCDLAHAFVVLDK